MTGLDDTDFFYCPHCDSRVAVGARVCRECGANADCGWNDHETDWSESEGLDDEFDYDEFVSREFGEGDTETASNRSMWIRLVILAIILSFALGYLAS